MKLIKLFLISTIIYFTISILMISKLLKITFIILIILSPWIYKYVKKVIKTSSNYKIKELTKKIDSMDGYEFEHYLKELFHLKDYKVKSTPLSNDQGADLLLNKNNEKIVVQAKRYSKPVGNKAVQEVIAAKHYYNCSKAIVITNNTFTRSAKQLAKRINVELWDRKELIKFINQS